MAIELDIATTRKTSVALGRIERARAAWGGGPIVDDDLRARMERAAWIESTAALCRMAGRRVDEAAAEAVLAGRPHELTPTVAREVAGAIAALGEPIAPVDRLLQPDDLSRLNATLGGDRDRPVPLRAIDLLREAFDADGRTIGRVFPGLPPRLLGQTLDDLLTWLEYELRDRRRNEVLAVAAFGLALLAASPFPARNGRTALAAVDLLLRRAGHAWLASGSLIAELERRRDDYHAAFDASRTGIWCGDADLRAWTELIVDAVDRVRERVLARIELEGGASSFPPLQRAILDQVQRHGTVDAGMLLEATGANRNTLKDNLRRLVNRGVLERSGQRRGTRYRLRPLT